MQVLASQRREEGARRKVLEEQVPQPSFDFSGIEIWTNLRPILDKLEAIFGSVLAATVPYLA